MATVLYMICLFLVQCLDTFWQLLLMIIGSPASSVIFVSFDTTTYTLTHKFPCFTRTAGQRWMGMLPVEVHVSTTRFWSSHQVHQTCPIDICRCFCCLRLGIKQPNVAAVIPSGAVTIRVYVGFFLTGARRFACQQYIYANRLLYCTKDCIKTCVSRYAFYVCCIFFSSILSLFISYIYSADTVLPACHVFLYYVYLRCWWSLTIRAGSPVSISRFMIRSWCFL